MSDPYLEYMPNMWYSKFQSFWILNIHITLNAFSHTRENKIELDLATIHEQVFVIYNILFYVFV